MNQCNDACSGVGNKLCVVGGTSTDREAALSSVECYDIDTGTWSADIGDLPASVGRPSSVVLYY